MTAIYRQATLITIRGVRIYGSKWTTVLFHGVEYKNYCLFQKFLYKCNFTVLAAKITVQTVKCTGTHRNFFSVTVNYPSAIFSVHGAIAYREREREREFRGNAIVRSVLIRIVDCNVIFESIVC